MWLYCFLNYTIKIYFNTFSQRGRTILSPIVQQRNEDRSIRDNTVVYCGRRKEKGAMNSVTVFSRTFQNNELL